MRQNWYKLSPDSNTGYKKDKNVVACRNCGVLFEARFNEETCPACEKREVPVFQRVKDYLWDNPSANMQQVSIECDVPINTLRTWVREGKVNMVGYRLDDDGK